MSTTKNDQKPPHLLEHGVIGSFSIGKCVKVLHCFHGHEFEIGEELYVIDKSEYDDAWLCQNAKGVKWYLNEEEGIVINCH